jgi:uncharacterized protein DUF3617
MKPPHIIAVVASTTNRLRFAALAIAVGAAASVGVPALAQTVKLRPGQYEATSEMALPAGSPIKMPAQKNLICLAAEDLKDLPARVATAGPFQNCKVTEQTVTATGIKFTKACTDPDGHPVTYAGDLTFTSSESYRQVVRISDGSGRTSNPMGSTITQTAKRIADCTK